jgi:hypothetical protein
VDYAPIPEEDEELARRVIGAGFLINFKVLVLKDGIKRLVC